MSLTHIRLNQTFNDDVVAIYKVESTDFSDNCNWEEIGTLPLFKGKRDYEFIESRIAAENKLIPPKLYQLTNGKRKDLLEAKYKNHGWGAWSMCIHHWAASLIKNNKYPKNYP